jgi:anti-sigma factor RsiW
MQAPPRSLTSPTEDGPDDRQSRAPDAIDELLPWHATGRLSAADRARVEAALAREPEVARRAALAEEEREETIALNESLGVPSSRAGTRFSPASTLPDPRRGPRAPAS